MSSSQGPAGSQGCGEQTVWSPGQSESLSLTHEGRERTFRVRLPAGYDPSTPAPVVFALHGGFGSAEITENQTTKFNPIAQREGVIMVYPEGVPKNPGGRSDVAKIRTWNAGGCCGYATEQGVDDVGFLVRALDVVERGSCVDRRRVFATGMSNGAMMSYRLACEASERFTAVAAVAGLLTFPECAPPRPVPLLHIHGEKDPNVPIIGGEGCGPGEVGESTPLSEIVSKWSALHACSGEVETSLEREDVVCEVQGDCEVEVCLLPEGNHTWPGGVPREPRVPGCSGGQQVLSFEASEYIWSFFERQSLPEIAL